MTFTFQVVNYSKYAEIAVRNLHNYYKKMLDSDLSERQTTFTKNVIKTFRPKTFGHPRFE